MMTEGRVLDEWFEAVYDWRLSWDTDSQEIKQWMPEKRWLALLVDINDQQLEEIQSKVKLPRQWRKDMESYVGIRKMLRDSLGTMEEIDGILAGVPEWLKDILEFDDSLKESVCAYRKALTGMDMGITGNDLRGMGVPEGPHVGRLLRQIRARWLEGRILNRNDENSYVEMLIRNYRTND
jgi:tRNA nucleotidyltransferase (CCA-adding enzyme)